MWKLRKLRIKIDLKLCFPYYLLKDNNRINIYLAMKIEGKELQKVTKNDFFVILNKIILLYTKLAS